MPQEANPVVQQRRLRSELRKLRDQAGLAQKDVAKSLEWSVSKVIRIETGATNISKTDLIGLLHHYGVKDESRIDELVESARLSRQSAWWDKYRDAFPVTLINFISFEASARIHRQYHGQVIPGLLQTREYAEDVITSYGTPPERISRGTELRLARQQLLGQDNAPELFFILDEAVIRRWVGGPAVMREQLERLKELNRHPNISIQIIRFSAGAHIGMKGPFTIFEFPEKEDEQDFEDYAVYLDYPDRDIVIQNDPIEASRFVETFYELEDIAAPKDETEAIIDEVLATFPGAEKGADGAEAES